MPDPRLHGNGEDCPACALRRDQLAAEQALRPDDGLAPQPIPCNFCGGSGRVGKAVAEIIREACEWAAAHYWPKRGAAFRAHDEALRAIGAVR